MEGSPCLADRGLHVISSRHLREKNPSASPLVGQAGLTEQRKHDLQVLHSRHAVRAPTSTRCASQVRVRYAAPVPADAGKHLNGAVLDPGLGEKI